MALQEGYASIVDAMLASVWPALQAQLPHLEAAEVPIEALTSMLSNDIEIFQNNLQASLQSIGM